MREDGIDPAELRAWLVDDLDEHTDLAVVSALLVIGVRFDVLTPEDRRAFTRRMDELAAPGPRSQLP